MSEILTSIFFQEVSTSCFRGVSKIKYFGRSLDGPLEVLSTLIATSSLLSNMVDDYTDLETLLVNGQIPQLNFTIYESYCPFTVSTSILEVSFDC